MAGCAAFVIAPLIGHRRFLAGSVAALMLSLFINPAQADEFIERLEGAVLAGSADALEQLRAELGNKPASMSAPDVYLWAYTSWRLAQRLPANEKKRRKRLLKDVQAQLEDLTARQPGDAEALALLGSVLGDRIDGALSGMRLGGRASKVLERANELAPDNPRVALQLGVGYFFTPKFAGGGAARAEQALRRALELYAEQPADRPWPYWGQLDALARLGEVLVDLERPEEARQVYLTALAQAPDFAWVRDELLPALDSSGR